MSRKWKADSSSSDKKKPLKLKVGEVWFATGSATCVSGGVQALLVESVTAKTVVLRVVEDFGTPNEYIQSEAVRYEISSIRFVEKAR